MINVHKSQHNNFDLLRFLAAIAVIFSHSFALCNAHGDPLNLISHGLFDFGGLAVAIFFTISGYLISASFIRRSEIIYFIWARFLRIFPGLFVAVIFCALIIGPLNTQLTLVQYFINKQFYSYLLKNVFLLHLHPWDYLPAVFENNPYPNAVNGSLWTLPLECMMYLLIGLLGLLGALTQNKLKGIVFFVTSICAVLLHFHNGMHYLSLHFLRDYLPSMSCFMFGTLFFIYHENIKINVIGLILLIALTFLLPHAYLFSLFYLTLSYGVLYFAFNVYYISGVFKKFGDLSYGLYIYAFPIQQTLMHYIAFSNGYYLFLSTVPFSMILAYLSWHIIEKKAIKLKSSTMEFLLPFVREGAEGG